MYRGKNNNSDNKGNKMNNKSNKTLREAIRKEIKQALNEGSKENKVADLYAYAGISTKYSNDTKERLVNHYGQDAVDLAIEMAPKILAFKKKLKDFAKEIKSSPEGKMLLNIAKQGKGYSGDHSQVTLGDLFKNL